MDFYRKLTNEREENESIIPNCDENGVRVILSKALFQHFHMFHGDYDHEKLKGYPLIELDYSVLYGLWSDENPTTAEVLIEIGLVILERKLTENNELSILWDEVVIESLVVIDFTPTSFKINFT